MLSDVGRILGGVELNVHALDICKLHTRVNPACRSLLQSLVISRFQAPSALAFYIRFQDRPRARLASQTRDAPTRCPTIYFGAINEGQNMVERVVLSPVAGADLSLSVPELICRVENGEGDQGDAMMLANELASVLECNLHPFLAPQAAYLAKSLRAIGEGKDANEAFHLTGKAKELPYDFRIRVAELMVQVCDDFGWLNSRKYGGTTQAAKAVVRLVADNAEAWGGRPMTLSAIRRTYFELRGVVQSRRHKIDQTSRNG